MKKISFIIPCYNEAASLPLLYSELCQLPDQNPGYEWEFLFINDGSTDKTLQVIKLLRKKDQRISYVDLSRNFGKENAMLAGFDYATGDCAVLMDADLQDPPALVSQMISKWEEGYEDVYARRNSRGKESWLRKHLSLLFYRILQKSSRFDILENVGDFRLLDRSCINALQCLRESERYTKGMFCWIGFKKIEIFFDRGDRITGNSTWNFWKLLQLAMEGITSFTTAPLRFSTILGAVTSLFAFIYTAFLLIKAIFIGEPVQGFPTIIAFITFLGGIQLLSLGIIGEYLARVFAETKNRPTYLAREYNDEKVYSPIRHA